MSTTREISRSEREGILQLPNNRQIAWADNGNRSSKVIALWFVGYRSIGSVLVVPKSLEQLDAHFISPTLPGNGECSTIVGVPYHIGICQGVAALTEHLHPGSATDVLYVGGGSVGTAAAQMLYGAPFGTFPLRRKIGGLLLCAPFSPFRLHRERKQSMSWQNWMLVRPPSQWIPFHGLARLGKITLPRSMQNVSAATELLRKLVTERMDKDERRVLQGWLEKTGITENE